MAGPAIKKYGGKVLARGPDADRLEEDVSGIVMMIELRSKFLQTYFITVRSIRLRKQSRACSKLIS